MLFKRTRKQFEKHNWVDIEKSVSNRSQKLRRIKNQSITGLEELALIAEKTPEGIQDGIFTSHKLEPLIIKILKLQSSLSHPLSVNKIDARRTLLCSMLINKCITFLKLQYGFLEKDSPALASIVLEQLDRAGIISNEIGNKVELLYLKGFAKKSKLEFLFDWNKVSKRDEALLNYLYGEIGVYFDIETIEKKSASGVLDFKLVSEYDEVVASVKVSILSEDTARMVIVRDSTKIEKELVLRKENDQLYVFRKINT
jgi:hypothetical protein